LLVLQTPDAVEEAESVLVPIALMHPLKLVVWQRKKSSRADYSQRDGKFISRGDPGLNKRFFSGLFLHFQALELALVLSEQDREDAEHDHSRYDRHDDGREYAGIEDTGPIRARVGRVAWSAADALPPFQREVALAQPAMSHMSRSG